MAYQQRDFLSNFDRTSLTTNEWEFYREKLSKAAGMKTAIKKFLSNVDDVDSSEFKELKKAMEDYLNVR